MFNGCLILFSDPNMFQVRDGVMTRVTMNRSEDNEITIAGGNMMNRLGLTRKDLQVRYRDSTQAAVISSIHLGVY